MMRGRMKCVEILIVPYLVVYPQVDIYYGVVVVSCSRRPARLGADNETPVPSLILPECSKPEHIVAHIGTKLVSVSISLSERNSEAF
jgi:hypothetical protein